MNRLSFLSPIQAFVTIFTGEDNSLVQGAVESDRAKIETARRR